MYHLARYITRLTNLPNQCFILAINGFGEGKLYCNGAFNRRKKGMPDMSIYKHAQHPSMFIIYKHIDRKLLVAYEQSVTTFTCNNSHCGYKDGNFYYRENKYWGYVICGSNYFQRLEIFIGNVLLARIINKKKIYHELYRATSKRYNNNFRNNHRKMTKFDIIQKYKCMF